MLKCFTIALMTVLLGVAGCREAHPDDPERLRLSAIPDQPADMVSRQHQALVDRICASIKRSCEWVPVDSYESLVERLGRGEIDIAYLGAATFAQASHRYQAVPLAMRDIDFRFTSVIVVPRNSKPHSLDDLKQLRFSFGNPSSTSGHLMLRQRLMDQGIVPERYFASVAFASDHDATIQAVASGLADAGGVNSSVFYKRFAAGDPSALALRVIWQSPPFTDYVWAARSQLSAPLRQALIDAFLDLDLGSEADRPALQAEGTSGFVPAFPSDFDEISEVLLAQGRM